MLDLKRLDHISMAAEDWRAQSSRLQKLLGFKLLRPFGEDDRADFDGCLSQIPGTGIEFEVISPVSHDSFVRKFLDESGPGLHHIAIEAEDITKTANDMREHGLTPFGGIQDDGQWLVTYVHPKESGGVLYQLFEPHEEPPEVDRSTPDGGAAGVIRADHVSLAAADLESQVAFQEILGMTVESRWEDPEAGYLGAVMAIPGSKLRFEIMQSTRDDSFVRKYIDENRPGLHHICLQVESVERAVEGLRREGVEAFGGIVEGWRRHTFVHPRDSGGVLFQLFEE